MAQEDIQDSYKSQFDTMVENFVQVDLFCQY